MSKTGQHNRVVFLAGPITSAPDWQRHAITRLLNEANGITVASPPKIGLIIYNSLDSLLDSIILRLATLTNLEPKN